MKTKQARYTKEGIKPLNKIWILIVRCVTWAYDSLFKSQFFQLQTGWLS